MKYIKIGHIIYGNEKEFSKQIKIHNLGTHTRNQLVY